MEMLYPKKLENKQFTELVPKGDLARIEKIIDERYATLEIEQDVEEKRIQDDLLKFWHENNPEVFTRSVQEENALEGYRDYKERELQRQDLLATLSMYGIAEIRIETIPGGFYTLPVQEHFTQTLLPEGYGYKGGAARALLLNALQIDISYSPRDIDLVRFTKKEPYPGADKEIAQEWMSDDHAHASEENKSKLIDPIDSYEEYFTTRDFTINEVLATDTKITATKECILDTVRHIIRLTEYERRKVGPKLLMKAVRFYTEAIQRYGSAEIANISNYTFENTSIRPFWIALQMDKAFEIGPELGEKFIRELVKRRILPEHIQGFTEALEYIHGQLLNDNFHFRHAPVAQFEKEDELFQAEWVEYERLAKNQGMGRGK